MDGSHHIIEYNASCSLDISIFIFSRQVPYIIYVFMGVGNILCSLTALSGNIIILLALRHCTSLHPSSKSLFCSLAISDFAIGLVVHPLFAAYTFAIAWNNSGLFCTVGLPYSLTGSFLAIVSFWTLTVVALDRYLALILRFRYRAIVTVKRVAFVVILGWLFVAFCTASRTFSITFRRIISNAVLLVCLLLSSFFYIKTYLNLRQHKLQMDGQSSFSMSYYRKSLNSMFLVFCIFLCTYLPFVCALAAATAFGFDSLFRLLALDITSFVGLLNSSLNPVVYCWRIREIKREAKQLLRKAFPCYTAISRLLHRNRVMPFHSNSTVLRTQHH